ncbi:MAG: ABC transporter permease [Oscillospiraceae bacterium]|nr:ABC transporter permease [Oscillospiraceae bacterium]
MAYDIHISSAPARFELKLGEVWRYRDLIGFMVRRSFVLTYKQTVLGPAWLFLQPLGASALNAIVFGEIAAIGTDGIPQYLFYLLGTALWGLFASSMMSNASVFTSNAYIFGKVYFARLTVPIANTIVCILRFLLQMLIVMVFLVWYTVHGLVHPVWKYWLFLPLVMLVLALLGMSMGMVASCLTAKYRDFGFLAGAICRLWMYATPVVYPLSQLRNPLLLRLVRYNPITAPFEFFRFLMAGKGAVDPVMLMIGVTVTVLCFLGSVLLFNRVEKDFIDKV